MQVYNLFRKINYAVSLIMLILGLCAYAPKRTYMWLRFSISTVIIILFSFFTINNWEWNGFVIVRENMKHNFQIQIIIMLAILCQICFCYAIKIWDGAFVLTLAVFFQRLHFNIYIMLEKIMRGFLTAEYSYYFYILIYIITFCPFIIYVNKYYGKMRSKIYNGENNKALILILLGMELIDNIYNHYLYAVVPYVHHGFTMIMMRMYNTAFVILILYLLHNMLIRKNLQMEKQIMKSLSIQRSRQYDYLKELMQSINIKSHDLKKQISYLKNHNMEKEDLLKQIEDNIEKYDSIINTNNETLSLILTEKSIIFQANQISFSCMSGANDFSFMEGIDIYTLFANLLDNAMEACLKVEPSKRNIILVIKEQASFLSIHQENYLDGKLILNEGLPISTKNDEIHHGFGTKSIKEIVERYNGSLQYEQYDNICCVNILFPL